MDNKELAKEILRLAKNLVAADKEEPKKEEPKKEEPKEPNLLEQYKAGDVTDVLDALAKMKPLKSAWNAAKILSALDDEAQKATFIRAIGKRIKKD